MRKKTAFVSLNNEYVEPIAPKPKAKSITYMNAIVEAFKNQASSHPAIKKMTLSDLNNATCDLLSITPSAKMYKTKG